MVQELSFEDWPMNLYVTTCENYEVLMRFLQKLAEEHQCPPIPRRVYAHGRARISSPLGECGVSTMSLDVGLVSSWITPLGLLRSSRRFRDGLS